MPEGTDISNDTSGLRSTGNQSEAKDGNEKNEIPKSLKCFYIRIFSQVYECSRASFDFTGNKPPIPSDPIPSEHLYVDIQLVVSETNNGEDHKLAAAILTCYPKYWYYFATLG